MSINRCLACGGEIRLGAFRISFNRKRGVSHYLDHKGSTDCDATKGFSCSMLKPYPRRNEDTPWFQMIERWNKANATPADMLLSARNTGKGE